MRNFSARATTAVTHHQSTRLFAAISALGLALGALMVATNPAFADETRRFDLNDFTKIDISESVDGFVSQSDRYEVSATAKDQSTLDSLIIEKVGDTLNIYRKDEGLLNSLATMFGSSTPKVYITLPKLTAAKSSAGADLNIEAFSAKDLNLSVSSGADSMPCN